MSEKYFRGKITFIHHEKDKVTIEYVSENKIKNIQAVVSEQQQQKLIDKKLIKKVHRFIPGDQVKFVIKKAATGVFFADHVIYEFNNTLQVLIEKSKLNNNFQGYVKQVDNQYFIKEIESYLFFPLPVAKYEIAPEISESDKAVRFRLMNKEKPEKIYVELLNRNYSKGYLTAIRQYKKGLPIDGRVSKISPYGLFVILSESDIECKIPLHESMKEIISQQNIKPNDVIRVKITHLNPDRVIVEWEGLNK